MPGKNCIIFVVDDEPMIADLVEHSLLQHGYKTFKFYDPLKALAFADSNTPNLLLSDYRMPGMDGLTLATRIRERNPECIVLIMSGYAHEANNHPQRGICELLSKPVSLTKLLTRIAHLLQSADCDGSASRSHAS